MTTAWLAKGKKKRPHRQPKEKKGTTVEILEAKDLRHELFCQAYIKHKFNATRAYLEVFWGSETVACSSATRLFWNANIINRVSELSQLYLANAWVDAEWVLRKLREVVDRCMEWTPIYDANGNPTGVWRFNEGATLKALEMIGTFFQMFHSAENQLPQLPQASKEENDKIAQFISLHSRNYELRKWPSGDSR